MVIQTKSNPEKIPDYVIEFISQRDKFIDCSRIKLWLDENPDNRKLLDQLTDIWQVSLSSGRKDGYDELQAWKKFKNSLSISDRRLNRQYTSFIGINNPGRFISIAAIIILLFILSFLFYKNSRFQPNPVYSEFIVPYGSKSKIKLPDSSTVWINAGSQIKYSNQFNSKNRQVFLSGEAYFDVKESKHSFIVLTPKVHIKVLGTRFNVKAYPDEKTVETTVMKGMVEIFSAKTKNPRNKSIVLKPKQQIAIFFKTPNEDIVMDSISGQSNLSRVQKQIIDLKPIVSINKIEKPEIISSWKDDRWIIESEELQNLAKKLERRYDIKIVFKEESLKRYVFSGVLKDETVEQVLEAMKLTAPIGFKMRNNRVDLYEIPALKSKLQQKK